VREAWGPEPWIKRVRQCWADVKVKIPRRKVARFSLDRGINLLLQKRVGDGLSSSASETGMRRLGGKNHMERSGQSEKRSWMRSVLTDIQFWVPVVVLIGGLLLLTAIH
jgi:hypothetical protein